MHIKTTKLLAFDGLELKEATFCRQSFPDHYHDAFSIGIIEMGIEKLTIIDNLFLVPSHSVVIINPYDIHSNAFYDKDAWKYRSVYVSEEMMAFMQAKLGVLQGEKIAFKRTLIDDLYLYQMIMNCHESILETKTKRLEQLIKYLLLHYAQPRPDLDIQNDNADMIEAAQMLQAIKEEKITLDQLAAQYKMDKYRFIRRFKKQTGLTPISYHLLHKINYAKQLIAQDMPIVEVALESGFYDQSHFTHYFKKYIGIAPLTYKKGLMNL